MKFKVGDLVTFEEDAGGFEFCGTAKETVGKVVGNAGSCWIDVIIFDNVYFYPPEYQWTFWGKHYDKIKKLHKNSKLYKQFKDKK